jgi:hypothetical protein
MANRASEPVTLPWKRPGKGVSAAELGASFRVEQREDGWHCTVKVGRRVEVLATGMRRLRDAQCKAEAHAATLPEVAAAIEKQAEEESRSAPRAKQEAQATPAKTPRVDEPATATTDAAPPSLTFEEVSDGCICGKIEGRTWLADPDGGVSVPLDTDPAVAQEICRVATNYYTTRHARASGTPRAKSTARASTKAAAKRGSRKAKPEPPAPPPPPAAPKQSAKKGAAAKATSKAASKSKPTAAASVGKGKGKAASKKTATKTAAKAATKTTAKAATPREPAARGRKSGEEKAAAPREPAARGRKGGKASATEEKQAEAPTPPAKEKKVSKKPGENSKTAKDASCGCVTWAAVDGKIRGAAKHGTFVVEPEGKRHALYFYDADGQSRHLESGEPGKLRTVAEEMAARGQPVLRAAASGVDDAALMRAFLGDDA